LSTRFSRTRARRPQPHAASVPTSSTSHSIGEGACRIGGCFVGGSGFRALQAERRPDANAAALGTRTLTLSQLDPDVLTTFLENRHRDGYDLAACLRRIACPVLLQQGKLAGGSA